MNLDAQDDYSFTLSRYISFEFDMKLLINKIILNYKKKLINQIFVQKESE